MTQSVNLSDLFNLKNYKDTNQASAAPQTEITADDVGSAFQKMVEVELNEKGNENTLFYSDKYNEGFTHNGKIVNGGCTEKGMKKAILGDHITVYKDKNGDGKTTEDEAMKGVEAMADSYDSVLDLLTQEKFRQVLEKYGNGTFSNNCQFMKHLDEIREEFGIDIKEVPTQGPDGIAHRTYEISMVDENGNVIKDGDDNESTILFGDWVIPDGCAQGAEFDFIAVIDQAGYNCVSKADFVNNEALGGAAGYDQLLAELDKEFENVRKGGTSDYMQKGENIDNRRTYLDSKFEWWSKTDNVDYGKSYTSKYGSIRGQQEHILGTYDLNKDGNITDEELIEARNTIGDLAEKRKIKDKNRTNKNQTSEATQDATSATTSPELSAAGKNDFEKLFEEQMAANPDMTDSQQLEFAQEWLKDNGYSEDLAKELI